MVQLSIFTPLATLLAWTTLTVQPVAAQEWYVVGVHDEWEVERVGSGSYSTHDFSIGAMNMNTKAEDDDKHTGVGRSNGDICGAKLFDAEVWCFKDITQECLGYDVAAFKSRRCRTYCPSIGDKSPLYNYNFATSGEWLTAWLICDKPYP